MGLMNIVGPSGVEIEVDELTGAGLVAGGHAWLVGGQAPEQESEPAVPPESVDGGTVPAGNGSRETWAEYALANGRTEEDLTGLTRDEIRALFAE